MDFEKLQKRVEKMEKAAGRFSGVKAEKLTGDLQAGREAADAMKVYAETLRDVLMDLMKDRKEQVRPGHLFQDAAAKGLVPGEAAGRGDNLLIRWAGRVTPGDPRTIAEDATHLSELSGRLLPVLKAYRKEEGK